jgi:hypothetical protein
MFKISKEEKKIQFIYLAAFWIGLSILFCYVCFFNYSRSEIRSQDIIIEKMNEENALLKSQAENAVHIDSLVKMLSAYQPSTSQVFLKNNINLELNALKNIYEVKKADERYEIFNQLYLFNRMQFFDREAIWSSTNNTISLKKNAEDCEIGFKERQNNLNLRNAISTRQ